LPHHSWMTWTMSWLLTWMMTWQRVNHVAADVANADVSIFWKWRQHMPFVNRPNSRLGTNWIAISAQINFRKAHLHFIHSPFTFHTQLVYISYTAHIHFNHSSYTFQPNKVFPTDQNKNLKKHKSILAKKYFHESCLCSSWHQNIKSRHHQHIWYIYTTIQHHYQNTEAVYSVF
jgi:hypothetical protein